MENEASPVFERVTTRLREIAGPLPKDFDISEETEIYYDLGIYGDVLYFDLLSWAHKEFGVTFDIDMREHGPGELVLIPPFLKHRLDKVKRPYRSLKVRDIVAVIEAGSQERKGQPA